MNAFKATETPPTESKSIKITTTLYDLINNLNTKFFGPQWEHITYPDMDPSEDGHHSLAAQKINQMFKSGQITFQKPHSIQKHILEL
jgi:hypothetical protein